MVSMLEADSSVLRKGTIPIRYRTQHSDAEPIDLKKEALKKAMNYYIFANDGIFDETHFIKDMTEILFSWLISSDKGNNYRSRQYSTRSITHAPQNVNEMVIKMKNDRENIRSALIGKLKLEAVKFLNSPTAKLMKQINEEYGEWSPDRELDELPILAITLSEEIDSGREERI